MNNAKKVPSFLVNQVNKRKEAYPGFCSRWDIEKKNYIKIFYMYFVTFLQVGKNFQGKGSSSVTPSSLDKALYEELIRRQIK